MALLDFECQFERTWLRVAEAGAPLGDVTTVGAELHGAVEAVQALIHYAYQAQLNATRHH